MKIPKSRLAEDLARLGVQKDDVLLVHSSYKAIGGVEGGPHAVLDALAESCADGLLILPTHTWRTVNAQNPVFDTALEKPCVGILPTLFLERPGVVRSLHPTHSVAALGKTAAAYTAGEEKTTTPCGRGGCWGRLYDLRAKILFLGAAISRNTYLHSVEEWAGVPNRLNDFPIVYTVVDRGVRYTVPQYGHISGPQDLSLHFIKMREPFLAQGLAVQGKVGEAECYLCDAVGMGDLTLAYLQKNPDLFGTDAPVPPAWYGA